MTTFEKVINFRQAGGTGLVNKKGQKMKDGTLYRSAKVDSATAGDKATFKRLNIKSIVDLRGMKNYSKRSNNSIDDLYTPIFISNGLVKEQRPPKQTHIGYLYVVDMLSKRYTWHVVKELNIFFRLFSLVLVVIDFLFGTRLAFRFYGKTVVNKMELWQHYADVLEHSKPEVAEVLRLVSDPMNLPILIHCELGKDRTGYIIALILSCLEIDEDIIIQDYEKTEVGITSVVLKLN